MSLKSELSSARNGIRASFSVGLGAVALVVAVAALGQEAMAFGAKRLAFEGQRIAEGPLHESALEDCNRALRLDPNNFQALHLRAVKLKELTRWGELDAMLPRLLAEHPNQASALRLAGEEAFRRGEMEAAADLLWQATWINPTPPSSPAAYWRMTMVASERAARPKEALAAGMRALALMERDNYLQPADRRDLLLDVGEMVGRQGWPLAGAHLQAVARTIQVR